MSMNIGRLAQSQARLTEQLLQARADGDEEAIEALTAELEEIQYELETLEDDASMDRGSQGWR